MPTDLIPFSFESSSVRFIPNGESFSVVAKDVLVALEYTEATMSNIGDATKHVPGEWKGRVSIPTLGGIQEMLTFTEQGFYFFVNRSNKPKALPLQKWVAGDVLPTIRKTGGYALPGVQPAMDSMLENTLLAIADVIRTTRRHNATTEEKAQSINALIDRISRPPAPREPDWQRILWTILEEIDQGRYPYPYAYRPIDGARCLVIRTSHIMDYLRNSQHLANFWRSIRLYSDRVLTR